MAALNIVHLEDNDLDAEQVYEGLSRGGLECEIARVETEEDFLREIERTDIDVILADRNCPGCDGFRALSLAQQLRPDVPFIFVSSTLDHEFAVESLSSGVTDFVFKAHLPQLVPAIGRAVRECAARSELLLAQEHLVVQAELLDQANDAIIISDEVGVITYWNQGAERTYGCSKEDSIGRDVHDVLQTSFDGDAEEIEATLCSEQHWEGELRQKRCDGTEIWVSSRWTLTSAGTNSARLQINTDITARRQAESALRKSEERYRRFVEQDITGDFLSHADGRIITCNPAFARIFGFASVEDALASNFLSLLRSRKDGAELLERVRSRETVETEELEMRQQNGDPVYIVARLIGSFDHRGAITHIQGYLFNDTKRKRLEHQLMQAQKMEGLGTLAGGIAHDFNNILAIILGYATRLEAWRTHPEHVPSSINVIKEAVERGAALVRQLLTSARQTEARFTPLNLNTALSELEGMLSATFPKTIRFQLSQLQNLPLVTADPNQIHQVLLNLCVNARDAMPNGGTLTLETSMVPGAQLAEYFTGADARQYACVRVMDTGGGMSKEVKAHIFEPFFTTKERGKGTGLGLSVVYGVVNNHHGFVQVDSEPGFGTTFSIYLPLDPEAQAPVADPSQPAPVTDRMKTILLVEDEELLRELGITMLESEGYRVLAAKDGVEALEIFAANIDNIGLVVCDLGLPRLGGREVFLKMKESKPDVRVIVASGYLEPHIRSDILKAGVIDTIQKPYDYREMLKKIRAIIGRPLPA